MKPVKRRIHPDGRSTSRRLVICGVYEILHRPTNRRYVGSSLDVQKRLYWHLVMLNKGTHHCSYLQNVWNKYGPSGFELFLLETCNPVPADLDAREQFHMDRTAAIGLTSMNLHPAAGSGRGFKMSPKSKLKISAAAKTIANSKEGRKIRSERAKAMHAAGRIRYHRRRLGKFKTCSGCGVRFINARRPDGAIPQYKLCKSCREDYRPPGCPKGYRHTPEARRKISEAAKKMWQQVNSRALFDEGRPKHNYPGGGTCL